MAQPPRLWNFVASMADMTGLHILIVPAWWPSPEQPTAGVFFRDYALAYADAGARVGVIFPNLVSFRHLGRSLVPIVPRIEREFLCKDIPVIRIRGLHTALGSPSLQMWRYRSWLKRGLEAYRSLHGQPDVIHAMCSIPAGWACTTLRDELASRVVMTEHFGPFSAQMTRNSGESLVREAVSKAAEVVTVSERSREDMERFELGREILVCGNPVAREFLEAPLPAVTRKGPIRGLFVGRLSVEKGIRELVEAAITTSIEHNVEWHFVGGGERQSWVMGRFDSWGRSAGVRFHGELPRERVVEEMIVADFLVLPSYGETFGMVVAEALCIGLPVIVTSGTGCEEFVDSSNGRLVDIGSVESLRSELTFMIEHARAFDRIALSKHARSRFSHHAFLSFYSAIFRQVIDKSTERT
ncbi:MAG: glycosyltransferase [Planctomycetes bacterium]|nr:glycosyltransferase [Planctomycetota bacterium]